MFGKTPGPANTGTPIARKLEASQPEHPHAAIFEAGLAAMDHIDKPPHVKMKAIEAILRAKHFGMKGLPTGDGDQDG